MNYFSFFPKWDMWDKIFPDNFHTISLQFPYNSHLLLLRPGPLLMLTGILSVYMIQTKYGSAWGQVAGKYRLEGSFMGVVGKWSGGNRKRVGEKRLRMN
jgi:hypothetical protein